MKKKWTYFITIQYKQNCIIAIKHKIYIFRMSNKYYIKIKNNNLFAHSQSFALSGEGVMTQTDGRINTPKSTLLDVKLLSP